MLGYISEMLVLLVSLDRILKLRCADTSNINTSNINIDHLELHFLLEVKFALVYRIQICIVGINIHLLKKYVLCTMD